MFRTRACSAVPISVRLGAAAVAAVMVLGGCSGSGKPEVEAAEKGSSSASPSGSASPSESVAPTATATPTPSPTAAYRPATAEGPAENVPLPVMPELAKEKSEEGLEAFLGYWYALINYGFETGNTQPIEEISGSDCVVCRSFYRMVNNGYADDDWIVGGKIEILTNHSDFILTTDGLYQVLANIRQDRLEYRGPEKVLYGTDDGIDDITVQMIEASYLGDHWQATRVVTMK